MSMAVFRCTGLVSQPDETLISFASRAAVDSFLAWGDFQRVGLGTIFRSAHVGERKHFDWDRLAETLGVGAGSLFEMSERSFFVRAEDSRSLYRGRLQHLPWTNQIGYPCYNPAALERGQYWRLGWLRPDALVDFESGTLFLRECPHCRHDLARIYWPMSLPVCPECDLPLSMAPKVKAPAKVVEFAKCFSEALDLVYSQRPLDVWASALGHAAAVWHVVAELRRNAALNPLVLHLVSESGLGPWKNPEESRADDVARAALRHVQLTAAADFACTHYPEIMQRYGWLHRLPRNLNAAPVAIARALHDLAIRLGLVAR